MDLETLSKLIKPITDTAWFYLHEMDRAESRMVVAREMWSCCSMGIEFQSC